jgi:hypothetical protein
MINDLKNIGLHQNKTYTIDYPKIDEKIGPNIFNTTQ